MFDRRRFDGGPAGSGERHLPKANRSAAVAVDDGGELREPRADQRQQRSSEPAATERGIADGHTRGVGVDRFAAILVEQVVARQVEATEGPSAGTAGICAAPTEDSSDAATAGHPTGVGSD